MAGANEKAAADLGACRTDVRRNGRDPEAVDEINGVRGGADETGKDRKTVAGASELIERKSNSVARLETEAEAERGFDRADVARERFAGADLAETPGGCGGIDQKLC